LHYEIEFKPRAIKNLKALPETEIRRIISKIETLHEGLSADIKKLTRYTPEYRLRAGNYRVLFEVAGAKVIIYRIIDRKDAYKSKS